MCTTMWIHVDLDMNSTSHGSYLVTNKPVPDWPKASLNCKIQGARRDHQEVYSQLRTANA